MNRAVLNQEQADYLANLERRQNAGLSEAMIAEREKRWARFDAHRAAIARSDAIRNGPPKIAGVFWPIPFDPFAD